MPKTDATVVKDRVTLAILAGGEGSRMGHAKGLLTIKGRPILQYLLDELSWPGPTLLVTAPGREHPPGWESFTREVSDPEKGGGPLRGVLTALENAATPLLLVLTVDMPGMRRPQCTKLLDQLQLTPMTLGVMYTRLTTDNMDASSGPGANDCSSAGGTTEATGLQMPTRVPTLEKNQVEPFPCALRTAAIEAVRRRLAEKRRSIHGLLDEPGFHRVVAPADWPETIWTNLNRPSDLIAFDA